MKIRFMNGRFLMWLYYLAFGGGGVVLLGMAAMDPEAGKLFPNQCYAWVISSVLTWGAGWLGRVRIALLNQKNEARRLWNLMNPGKGTICLSAHQWEQTLKVKDGELIRIRQGVGEGQIRALPYVVNSLQAAYKGNFCWDRIYSARTGAARHAYAGDDDLILIGGPATNPLSKDILRDIEKRVKIVIEPYKYVSVCCPGQDGALPDNYPVKQPDSLSDPTHLVEKDCAIILHITTRGGTKDRKVVLIAGSTTFGTGAAAQYFCTRMSENKLWNANKSADYVAVLACDVDHGTTFMEKRGWKGFTPFLRMSNMARKAILKNRELVHKKAPVRETGAEEKW